MNATYNFSAGPAMLPVEVMKKAQAEFTHWQQSGCSVMEVSHRGKPFMQMAKNAEHMLRQLMNVPDNYKVLFMQGGGRGQFAAVPLNLSAAHQQSLHLVTGSWSKGAVEEAAKYNMPLVVGETTIDQGIVSVPRIEKGAIPQEAAYFHFCPNETVEGIAIPWLPDCGKVPVVADMSSCILSQPIDVSQYGVIYAGAQKNIGPSGLVVVIVREDLLDRAQAVTPSIFNYRLMADSDSMYNTPPTFSWYLAGLVFEWLLQQGGLPAIAQRNHDKARLLYDAIDTSDFYRNNVAPENRSIMNVPFQLADASLDARFLTQAEAEGLLALKGHRIVGGMRASIYNAMPIEGVQALVAFMREFERVHG